MRSFFRAALNCFVGDEPGIAATTQIASPRVRPARDVAFVLIWNSDGEPIHFDATGLGEMKNVFVTIVQEAFGTDWLEMTDGARVCSHGRVARLQRDTGLTGHRPVATEFVDRNGFDPVNRVLENEETAQRHHNLMW